MPLRPLGRRACTATAPSPQPWRCTAITGCVHSWMRRCRWAPVSAGSRRCWRSPELAAGIAFLNGRGLLHLDAHFENILTDGRRPNQPECTVSGRGDRPPVGRAGPSSRRGSERDCRIGVSGCPPANPACAGRYQVPPIDDHGVHRCRLRSVPIDLDVGVRAGSDRDGAEARS